VIIANVLSYFDPLRQMIQNGIKEGFIPPQNASLIIFVDGPADPKDHKWFDWGKAILDALDSWDEGQIFPHRFNWTSRADGTLAEEGVEAT
jgi:hypothetical protein